MRIEELVPDYIVLAREFLSPERCAELVRWSEEQGYEEARLSDGSRRTEVRSNDRLIFDDHDLAGRWFERLRATFPVLPFAVPIGLNERFRFYRYHPGQSFRHHRDGVFRRSETEFSQFTLLAYLNADFEGGETSFGRWSVTPETGMALLFRHEIEHAGASVVSGTKYVLRTDVMYRLEDHD
jgi:predicted 2-oxoglutarate/Fe(II)-dependent dioxygenase YbiX